MLSDSNTLNAILFQTSKLYLMRKEVENPIGILVSSLVDFSISIEEDENGNI